MQEVQKIASILKIMYPIPKVVPPIPSSTVPPAIISPPALTSVLAQPIPPTQSPEEQLCQYHLLRERQVTKVPVTVPVPRADPLPTKNIAPQVSPGKNYCGFKLTWY